MAEGFYADPEKKKTKARAKKADKAPENPCEVCGRASSARSPFLEPAGRFKKGIMLIGSAPDGADDAEGKPGMGGNWTMIRQTLRSLDVDLDRDCLITNAVCCFTGKDPTDKQVKCCNDILWRDIEEYKPKLIIPMGEVAINAFLQYRIWHKKSGGINRWRGWQIPDRTANAWLCPTFHPGYVRMAELGKGSAPNPMPKFYFRQDMTRAISILANAMPPRIDARGAVRVITRDDEAALILRQLWRSKPNLLAVDFETTGLKPYNRGHRIKSASVYAGEGKQCYSFLLGERSKLILAGILGDGEIRKTGHHIQFESAWSEVFLGTPVRGWVWDSMIVAHALDNRPKATDLKFQTYMNFGEPNYAHGIDTYLQSADDGGANAFNRIDEAPVDELLMYGGLDSVYQWHLATKQMETLGLFPFDLPRLT